jgi:hypothetical protein
VQSPRIFFRFPNCFCIGNSIDWVYRLWIEAERPVHRGPATRGRGALVGDARIGDSGRRGSPWWCGEVERRPGDSFWLSLDDGRQWNRSASMSKGGGGFELAEKTHGTTRRGNRLTDELRGRMARRRPSFIERKGGRRADGRRPAPNAVSMASVLED